MGEMFAQINYGLVAVAGVLSLVIGFAWMTLIFGKPYRKHMYGMEVHQKPPASVMIQSFVAYILVSFVTALAYAVCLELWQTGSGSFGYDGESFVGAVWFTLLLWAGYTLPFTIGKKVWQFKNWIVVGIDSSYELVRFAMFLLLFWFWG